MVLAHQGCNALAGLSKIGASDGAIDDGVILLNDVIDERRMELL